MLIWNGHNDFSRSRVDLFYLGPIIGKPAFAFYDKVLNHPAQLQRLESKFGC